jgi:hypothetical protein
MALADCSGVDDAVIAKTPRANHSVTAESLKTATAEIGATQAELRDTHLKCHLRTAQILSAEQMQHCSMLRGYESKAPPQHHHTQ